MSGLRAKLRGSGGVAPTGPWFGSTLPDKINMLRPFHQDSASPNAFYYDKLFAANYFNQWTPYNTSFGLGPNAVTGSFTTLTTAPDGTNTAQLFAESSGGTQHFANAGCHSNGILEIPRIKLAGFFKSGGRRLCLGIEVFGSADVAGFPGGGLSGVRAIFDLAGGQIAVDNAVFGTAPLWTVYPAKMQSFGNGWYLCSIEVKINSTNLFVGSSITGYARLDNGTGLAAASLSYSGDGASGVYGWRTNLLPSRAYALNSVTLFEDFNDLSSIDTGITNAPGYKFYSGGPWPVLYGDRVPPPGTFTAAGSVLTLHPWPSFAAVLTMQTAKAMPVGPGVNAGGDLLPVAGGAVVGKGYKLPMLHEIRCTWAYDTEASGGAQTVTPWCWDLEFINNQPGLCDPNNEFVPGALDLSLSGREMDFFESFGGGGNANAIMPSGGGHHYRLNGTVPVGFTGDVVAAAGSGPAALRIQPWSSVKTYPLGTHVKFGGSYYTCITGGALGNAQDPTNAAFWGPYSLTSVTGYATPVTTLLDNVMHTYQVLMLPATQDDYGCWIIFFDGAFTAYSLSYGRDCSLESRQQTSDGHNLSLMYGTGDSSTPTPLPFLIDWISVTQQ